MTLLVGSLTMVAVGLFVLTYIDEAHLKLGMLGFTALVAGAAVVSIGKLLEINRLEQKIEDQPEVVRTFARTRLEWVLLSVGTLLGSFSCYTPLLAGFGHPIMQVLTAWVGASLTLLGIFLPLFFLLSPRRLTLSPQGLDYSVFRARPIPWREIMSVEQGGGLKAFLIYLHLAEPRPPLVIKCHHLGNVLPPVILNATKLRLKAFGLRRPTEKS